MQACSGFLSIIVKYPQKLPYIIDNLREKPFPQRCSLLIMYFAPVFCEIPLEPLHYFGKGLTLSRFDEQVNVIIHDTEVQELKRLLLFCFFDEGQEHNLDPRLLDVHLAAVNFRGNVIDSSVMEFS
jgi:hypothetical protein